MRGAETDIVASVGQTDLEYDEFSECKVSGSCLRTLYRSRWNTIIDKEDVEVGDIEAHIDLDWQHDLEY